MVALDSLSRLSSDDTTDSVSAIGNGDGGGWAETINNSLQWKRYQGDNYKVDGASEGKGWWDFHWKDCDTGGFFFFIDRTGRERDRDRVEVEEEEEERIRMGFWEWVDKERPSTITNKDWK